MRINFTQSGGFAGIDTELMLDSNSLTSSEMNEIQAMLEDSGFFELSSSSHNPMKGADYFVYEITVETDGRIHRVKTTDLTMPSTLAPLITFLRQKKLGRSPNK